MEKKKTAEFSLLVSTGHERKRSDRGTRAGRDVSLSFSHAETRTVLSPRRARGKRERERERKKSFGDARGLRRRLSLSVQKKKNWRKRAERERERDLRALSNRSQGERSHARTWKRRRGIAKHQRIVAWQRTCYLCSCVGVVCANILMKNAKKN